MKNDWLDKIIQNIADGFSYSSGDITNPDDSVGKQVRARAKAAILKHLKIAELKARHDELRELPKSRWEGHEHCVGWDTVDDRLSELESQIKELSDENRGCPHCKPENFPKMMTGIYGCPCSCHASQEPSLNKIGDVMKVVKSEDNLLEFDNGLVIEGDGDVDCCAYNFLDFEQLPVGTELPTMSAGQFVDKISLKNDGFAIKDSTGTPKWIQARSNQNGYYSNMTTLVVKYKGKTLRVAELSGEKTY